MAVLSVIALALAGRAAAEGVWVTPHDSYSSSIGVLGCKINTDRVAYWPGSVDCDNFCVKLSHGGRSVHLLRIDQSGGAHDISYDAYVYLQTGKSAATDPLTGGSVAMEFEEVDASECAHLIYTEGSKLPLSASNSINFLASCLDRPNSYVARNHVLFNICDAICSLGHDEECHLDMAVSNQPSCPHTLGLTTPLTTAPVFNILYQTGQTVVAGTGEVAVPRVKGPSADTPKVGSPPSQPEAVPTQVAPPPTVQSPSIPAAVFAETAASAPSASTSKTTGIVSPPPASSSASAGVPTLVPVPAPVRPSSGSPSFNETAPNSGKPVTGSSTNPLGAGTTASSPAVSSSTRPVVASRGTEMAKASLLSLFAGVIACSAFMAL